MRAANDGFRFLLETAGLVSFGYWGWQAVSGPSGWVLALVVPIAVATGWATWIAANSSRVVPDPWRFLLEVAVFGGATGALAAAGQTTLAIVYGSFAAIHLLLTFVLHQRRAAGLERRSVASAMAVLPEEGS